MAVLNTIREKLGILITILIAIALLSFIVDFNSLSSAINSSSSKYTVGKINGQKVSYKDFQEQVEYQTSIAEILGGAPNTDEQQKRVRDAAWQYFVDKDLFIKNAKAAGFAVGKAEVKEMTVGSMPSPVVMYDPIFGSPNGNFDATKVVEFVKNIDNDASGSAKAYWEYIQKNVVNQQYYAKYGSLFASTNLFNKLSVSNDMNENNVTASIEVVSVPFGFEKDTTIVVSSSEIKKYYDAHKDLFKQKANRDIEYALIEVVPSAEDKSAANKAIADLYEEFESTDNLKNFIMRNSDTPFNDYFYKAGELRSVKDNVDEFVFGSKSKGASQVFQSGDEFYAVRVVETKNIPDSVYVRHILVQNDNALADSLFGVVSKNRSKFAEIAAIYSVDQNAANGEIGWMTQTYMIPGFESVISAEANKPFVLDTKYGRHIVEVTKKTKAIEKKKVAIFSKTAIPSKATMNEAYNKANALATQAAGKLEALQAAAKEQGIYLRPMNVTEATAQYSAVDHAKEVTRWIFEAKKGAASNVITVNQNCLFVVGVKEIHKEGYSTVAEVSANIEPMLYAKKLAEKKAAEVAAKIESCNTIQEVAEALGSNVETIENISFASRNSRENEPALVGAVASAQEGKIVGPVKGNYSIYVFQLKNRDNGAFYTEEDAKNFAMQKNQYMSQMILPVMLDSSNSVDNRERFY